MSKAILAGVAAQNVTYHLDKSYDYSVPGHLQEQIAVGSRVLIPFGRGTALRQGVVVSLRGADPEELEKLPVKIKEISAVLDSEPLYTPEMIRLGEYMRDHTFCTLFDALKAMVPTGAGMKATAGYSLVSDWNKGQRLSREEQNVISYLGHRKGSVKRPVLLSTLHLASDSPVPDQLVRKGILNKTYSASRNISDATVRMLRMADSIQTEDDLAAFPEKLTQKQRDTALALLQNGPCSVKELLYYTGVSDSVVKTLLKKNVIVSYEKETFRLPYEEIDPGEPQQFTLSTEQEECYQTLCRRLGSGRTALLYGVTGSGKTNVYLKLISEALKRGLGVIVMVPEISLTPQTLRLFYQQFGDTVAVFHSGLSTGERFDEWKRVRQGLARIAVGTRSAVFAPVSNLGLIIMDEEQEETYQSDMSPRYHARDIARYRTAEKKGLLLLTSATPSLESYAAAQAGRYDFLTLTQRYGNAVLPEVRIVDMRKEQSRGNRYQISRPLYEELSRNLESCHQSILLINRRGYNTYAVCDACGEAVTCPNCSISLTYHRDNQRLVCHYCGYSTPFTTHCEHCGENEVRYTGKGTQKIEEELQTLFPAARVLRMDADSTMQKYAYDEKLNAFRQGDYDIMIGTQMVAKGLDFPNVTLVGVLSADNELYNDDYKSMERTFDLITQVVGRSGRGETPGKALIQTLNPDNEVIRLAARQDYPAFYRQEILMRRAMVYPPFCTLVSVRFKGRKAEHVQNCAGNFLTILKQKMTENPSYQNIHLIALGPMPERIVKVSGNYRYRLLIKCRNNRRFRSMLSECLQAFGGDRANGGVSVVVEIRGN